MKQGGKENRKFGGVINLGPFLYANGNPGNRSDSSANGTKKRQSKSGVKGLKEAGKSKRLGSSQKN